MAPLNAIGSKLAGVVDVSALPTTTGTEGWGLIMRAADGTLQVLPTEGAAMPAIVPSMTITGRNDATDGASESLTPAEVKEMLGLTNAVVPDPATGTIDPALLPPVVLPPNIVYTDPDTASPTFGKIDPAVLPDSVVIKDPATGFLDPAVLPPSVVIKDPATGFLDPTVLPPTLVYKVDDAASPFNGKINPADLPTNVPGGIVSINETTGKIDPALLPDSGGAAFYVVADVAARDALANPVVGDTVKVSDSGQVYRLTALPNTWELIGDSYITASDVMAGVFAPERLGVTSGGAMPDDTMILQGDGQWVSKMTLAPEMPAVLITAAGDYVATKNAVHVITATDPTPASPVAITLPVDDAAIALTPKDYNDKICINGGTDKYWCVKVPAGVTVFFANGDSATNGAAFGTYTAAFGGVQEKYVSFELNRIGLNSWMLTRLNGNLW